MRQFTMHDSLGRPHRDIAVLVRLRDMYAPESVRLDLIIDPWRLFNSQDLRFDEPWEVTGSLREDWADSSPEELVPCTDLVSWTISERPKSHTDHSTLPGSHLQQHNYEYQVLAPGQIRLLQLMPGKTTDQLRCAVIHVSTSLNLPTLPYQALSYVWGTESRTQSLITIDGVLLITHSLEKALRRLRSDKHITTLWVDAVCINQDDPNEKAKQISLLSRIFQNATCTYAFIDGGTDSEAALQMLMQVRLNTMCKERATSRHFDKTRRDEMTEDQLWPKDIPKAPQYWGVRGIPHPQDRVWALVEAFFSLPWFRRVWIIQEVVVAHNVEIVCGKWAVDWSDLHEAMRTVDRQLQLDDFDTTQLRSSWQPFLSLAEQREWEARDHRWALIMLLEHFRNTESTLGRDRLIAMLGLACDGDEPEFEPDYASSFEHVLLNFARGFVRQGRGIQLLSRAGLCQNSDRFPSWIPNWTIPRASSLHDMVQSGYEFLASGPQEPVIAAAVDSDALLVRGYIVDVLELVSALSNDIETPNKYLDEVDMMVETAVLTPSKESREDLKWQVPIAGALYGNTALFGAAKMESSYRVLRESIKTKTKAKKTRKGKDQSWPSRPSAAGRRTSSHVPDERDTYLSVLHDTVHGWRFVITEHGFVGTVPESAEAGDVVVILKGAGVPFVLRKSSTRPGAFRLVGECYIHGMMNGEALSLPQIKEEELQLH
jgi:hypothetical protein